jgi:hypothetical protein
MTVYADEVAQIQHLEQFECLWADDIEFYVDLKTLSRSGDMRETCLAMQPHREDASSHSNRWFFGFERCGVGRRIFVNKFRRSRGPIELVGIRLMAASFDLGKLLLALKILILRLER